ncbi:glycosyltransferase [Myxococcaceae bacterium GXIMD 01537]
MGNQVRYLQKLLRGWGVRSDIYADQWDEACREQVKPASRLPRECSREDVLLVHHSFESRCVPVLRKTRARQALIYHNVTPAPLFEGFDRKVAQACDAARDELREMQAWMERAYAYSRFSAEELGAAGYTEVSELPFALDWSAFDVAPDPMLKAELDDGCANILFVGRAVPSKRLDDVMRVFSAYQSLYQPRSRLVLAGYLNRETPNGAYLYGVKELLGSERVRLLGRVSAAQLSACYATATVYLSMSRHEGFGVPLLEAMHRDVPVVAYGAAAVPETMGGAGVTTLSDDPVEVARVLAVLERRVDLRWKVIESQRARLRALGQANVAEQVHEGLRPLLESAAPRTMPPPPPEGVALVCPDFERSPDAPLSALARHLKAALPHARLLTLRAEPESAEGSLVPMDEDGVWRFLPDQPLPRQEERPAPGSSSMETYLRRARGPVVFLGVDSAVARATLPHVLDRACGVRDARGQAASPELAGRLGARLLSFEPGAPDTVAARLVEALKSLGEKP